MQSMIISFNAIFPILAFMMIGFFLKSIKLLDVDATAGLNKLVFNVLLPANIINSILKADIQNDFDVKIALYAAFICISSFLIVSYFVNPREKDKTIAPVVVQGMYKSNYNLLAIPIATSFYGSDLGMAAILVMAHSKYFVHHSIREGARQRCRRFSPGKEGIFKSPRNEQPDRLSS